MLLTFSRLLRRGRLGISNQCTGTGLQSSADCISVDLLNNSGAQDVDGVSRLFGSEAAKPSLAVFSADEKASFSNHSFPQIGCFGLWSRHASTASDSHTARRREILRDAAQKVSPGSTWLLAYSHNIDPRQLTFRLGKRSTLHDLQEGWALYQQKFDTVAMAALLRRVRVAQLQDTHFDAAAAQQLLTALEPRLRTVTLRFGKLRDTVAYLHALAKLRSPPPTAPPGVAGLPDSASGDDAPGTAAPAAAATAAAAVPPGNLLLSQPAELVLDLAAWATRDRTQVIQASPRRLATLLWALLRTLPPAMYDSEKLQVVLDRVALCSIRRWSSFAPQDMRVYAVSYATFGPRGTPPATRGKAPGGSWRQGGQSSWLGSISSWPETARKPSASGGSSSSHGGSSGSSSSIGSSGSSEAAPTGRAEGQVERRQKRNALVLQVAADTLAQRVGDLTAPQPEARDLALVAHALALQGVPEPNLPLLMRAAEAAIASPRSLQPLELVLLVEALALYGVRQPALLDVVRQQAHGWAGPTGSAGVKDALELQLRLVKAYERLGAKM